MCISMVDLDVGCRTAVEDSERAVGLPKWICSSATKTRRKCGGRAARLDGMKKIKLDRGLAIGSTFMRT